MSRLPGIPSSPDILIAGGGLIGMVTALALAGEGVPVTVVDALDPEATLDAAFDGRVSAIAAASQQYLERLGVWGAMADDAQPIRDIRVVDGDSRAFVHFDHREIGDAPMGYIAENRHIRRALVSCAKAQKRIHWITPARVAQVEHSPHRVTVTLDTERQWEGSLLIGADGKGSRVREQAGIRVHRKAYGQTAIVCTVAHAEPHQGLAVERFLPDGPFAILPMTGARSSLVWTEPAARAERLLALPEAVFMEEISRRFGDFLGALELAGPRWSYPLSRVWVEHLAAERIALVGDAGHGIHPLAGQGYNVGLRDVEALAALLSETRRWGGDLGSRELLTRYERRRRADILSMTAATDGLNRLFSTRHPVLTLGRRLGLRAVEHLPFVKHAFMRHAMGYGRIPGDAATS